MADTYDPSTPTVNPVTLAGAVSTATGVKNPLPDYVSPETYQTAVDAVRYVGDAFDKSEDQVRSNIGWHKAFLGLIPNEEAKLKFNPTAIQQQRDQNVVDYEKTHDFLNYGKHLFPMMSSIKNWAANAFGGAAVGGASGAAGGGLVGGLPGAALGGAAGATWGFRGAATYSAVEQASGQVYGDLITKGVDPTTAREAGAAAGAMGGAMQGWFLNPILKYQPVTEEVVKQTAGQIAGQISATVGKSIAASDVTTGTELMVRSLAELKTGKKVAPTWQEASDAMIESTIAGAAQGLVAGGIHAAGAKVNAQNQSGPTEGPFTLRVRAALAHMPQNKEELVATAERLKGELVVAKKQDAVAKAETKLAEAQAEGEPTKLLKMELEVKKAELAVVQPSATILQGKVETTAKGAAPEKPPSRDEQKRFDLLAELDRVSKEGLKASIDKENAFNSIAVANDALALAKDEQGGGRKVYLAEKALERAEAQLEKNRTKEAFRAGKDPKYFNSPSVDKLKGKVEDAKINLLDEKEKHKVAIDDAKANVFEMKQQHNQAQTILKGWQDLFVDLDDELTSHESAMLNKQRGKIEALLDKNIKDKNIKGKKLTVSIEAQDLLNEYRKGIDNQQDVQKFITEYGAMPEEIKDSNIYLSNKYNAYNQVAGYHNFNYEQLKDLRGEIENVVKTGKSLVSEKQEQAKQRYDAMSTRIRDAVRGGRSDKKLSEFVLSKGAVKNWKQGYRYGGHTISVLRMLVDMAVQDAEPAEREAILNDLDFTENEDNVKIDLNTWTDKWKQEASGGDKKLESAIEVFLNESSKPVEFGEYTNLLKTYEKTPKPGTQSPIPNQVVLFGEKPPMQDDAGGITYTIKEKQTPFTESWGDALNIYAQMKDPDLRRRVEASGYTFKNDPDLLEGQISTEELIEEKLKESIPAQRVLSAIQKVVYQDFGKEYAAPVTKDIFGVRLSTANKSYSGLAAGNDRTNPYELDVNAELTGRRGMTPNSIYDRTKNAQPLRKEDIVGKATRHLTAFATAKHMTDKARMFAVAFNDKETKDVLGQLAPKTFLPTLNNAYQTTVGQNAKHISTAFGALDDLRRKIGTSLVAGKALAAPKQATAIYLYGFHMPHYALMAGLAENRLHPERVEKFIKASKTYTARDQDLALQVLNNVTGEQSLTHSAYADKSMYFVQKGDKWTIAQGGAAYAEWYAKNKATGETPDERYAQGVAAADRVSTATQSSSNKSQQTEFERSGSLGRALMLFKKQNIQTMGHVAQAGRQFVNKPSPKTAAILGNHLATAFFTSFLFKTVGKVGSAAFLGGLSLLVGKKLQDDFDPLKFIRLTANESITDFFNAVPFLGGALEAVVLHAFEKGQELAGMGKAGPLREPGNGIGYDQIMHAAKAVNMATDAMFDALSKGEYPTAHDYATFAHELAQSVGAKTSSLPIGQVTNKIKVLTKEPPKEHFIRHRHRF